MNDKLWSACFNGRFDDAVHLVTEGADVNWVNEDGRTPLFSASSQGHTDIVRLLLNKGAAIDRATNNGETPLCKAALRGYTDVVRLLLMEGAAVDKAMEDGYTPLLSALLNGHTDIVRLLLDKGAAIDKADHDEWTPLLSAAMRGHTAIVRMLLDKGAAVDKADENGDTPLSQASFHGRTDVVRLLLNEGAATDKATKRGDTPLITAASEGHTDIVRLLLDKGAAIDKANKDGRNPIIKACYYGHLPIVQLLCERGANLHSADKGGFTALKWANMNGHSAVAAYMKEQQEKERSAASCRQQKERSGNSQGQGSRDPALEEQVKAMQKELAALKAQKEATPKGAPLDDCRIHPSCLKEGPELGRGGFGVVLHGQLQLPGQSNSRKVAIKKLSLGNPTEMQRTEFTFEVIATVQASRRCPHVLHCYGYSALSDGSLCLVMKYYEKGTLQDLVIHQVYDPLPMKQVLQLALDIALGVQELHAAQILVDDIKASNVLIDDDGGAVIADFGLSRPLVDKTHVSASVVAGTMAYMAPEKHEDADTVKFGFPADIWALGITLAQIVAADVAAPWRGQSISYIIKKLVLEKKPPEVEATPELPGLQKLIQDCLRIEPRSRPTADMVVKRLQDMTTEYNRR